MIKYRFPCTDKENIICDIGQIIMKDFPCGKTLFGGDMYRAGIHFQRCDDIIKGFYIDISENESSRGGVCRVCFIGKFVENQDELFFDCYIFPAPFEFISLILCLLYCLFFPAGVFGTIVCIAVFSFFIKGYYDLMNVTYDRLKSIFK